MKRIEDIAWGNPQCCESCVGEIDENAFRTLAEDPVLRTALNENLELAARGAAPEFAGFLTRHIADTVKHWDSGEMSHQVEINIGKDLQYIRINGTIVGGLIGVVLYLLSALA